MILSIKILGFYLSVFFLTNNLVAQHDEGGREILAVKSAVFAELNNEGLSLLASEIQQDQLNDIEREPLDDFKDKVDQGVEVRGAQMFYWVKFRSIDMAAKKNAIIATVNVEDVKLEVGSLRFKKNILGGSLRSTCYDTRLQAGHKRPLVVKAQVKPGVVNGEIKLDVTSVSFNLPGSNYKISGPRKCTGDLGTGYLVKAAVREVLGRARGKIEDAVKKRIKDTTPEFAKKLQEFASQSFPLELKEMPPIPETKVSIRTAPERFEARDASVAAVLSGIVEHSNTVHHDEYIENQLEFDEPERIGKVGFNPRIFRDLLDRVTAGGEWYELTSDDADPLKEVLSVRSASSIWPQLLDRRLDSDTLRLKIRIKGQTEFRASTASQGVLVSLPVQLRFSLKENQAWEAFFDMNMVLETILGLQEQRGNRVSLRMVEEPHVSLQGRWLGRWKTIGTLFERDVAEFLFTGVFDYIYESGPMVSMVLPDFSFGGQKLVMKNFRIRQPYIFVDIALKKADR